MGPLFLNDTAASTVDVTVCLLATYRLRQLNSIYRELSALLERKDIAYEFLVIANDVDEESGIHVQRFSEIHSGENSRLQVFRARKGMNKASSLKAVEHLVRGNIVVTVETGARFVAQDVEKLLSKISEGYDFVNAVRDWSGEPFFNRFQSKCFNWMTRKLTGSHVHDVNSTLKAFRNTVLGSMPLYGDFYRFFPILAEQKGFRVAELPVERREEQKQGIVYGPGSYIRRLLDILNLIFLTRFTEKPLRFFGGIGVVFLILGFLINVYVTFERYVHSKGLAERPLLLLGILLMVVGIQSISIGLIGEMIVFSKTKDFHGSEVERVV